MSLRSIFLKLNRLNRVVVGLVLLGLPLALAAFFGAKPLYHTWKQGRMLKVAEACAARGDDHAAVKSFQIALRADPRNPVAWRKFGEFLDRVQPGAALVVWERLAALEPDRADSRYRAVGDALLNHDGPRARTNLNLVPAEDRGSAEYRLLDARTLMAENQLERGEEVLEQLVKDDGAAGEAGFRLDVIRLSSRDIATQEQAEGRIRDRVRSDGPLATEALRALVVSEMERGTFVMADADSEKLIRRPDATAQDRARFLELEFRSNSLSLPDSVDKALARTLEHPEEIGPLMEVLGKAGKADFVLNWFEKQPPEKLASEPIRRVRIWLAFANRDVERAFTLLGTGRNALSAEKIAGLRKLHAEFAAGNPKALTEWNAALGAGDQDPDWLSMMGNLAAAWGWTDAQESAYRALTEVTPRDPQVWQGLLSIVSKRDDAVAMLRASNGLIKADPNLLPIRTLNLTLDFLLGYGDKADLLRTAEADAAISPAANTQLVYAMYLTAAGRNREAVAVADRVANSSNVRLSLRQRIYVSYIYAAAGSLDKARAWFVSKEAAQGLVLPEELALAVKATDLVAESDRRRGVHGNEAPVLSSKVSAAGGTKSVIGLRGADERQSPLGEKAGALNPDNDPNILFLPIVGVTPSPRGKIWTEN